MKIKKCTVISVLLISVLLLFSSCRMSNEYYEEKSRRHRMEWLEAQEPIEYLDVIRDYIYYSGKIPERDFPALEEAIVELYRYLEEAQEVFK